MSMKNVLVTGASRGIGRAIAAELAGLGHAVTINYRRGEEPARQLQEEIAQRLARRVRHEVDDGPESGRLLRARDRAGRFLLELSDESRVTLVSTRDDAYGGAPRTLIFKKRLSARPP